MFIKSIRWRLQLWLAFLLVCTLSGFGIATYEAHRIKQYQQVDEQLGRHFDMLVGLARSPQFPGGHRPAFNNRNRREPPWELRGGADPSGRHEPPARESGWKPAPDSSDEHHRLNPATDGDTNAPAEISPSAMDAHFSSGFDRLRQEDQEYDIYVVVWNREGNRIINFTNTPVDLKRPLQTSSPDSGPHFRNRAYYREVFDFNRDGRCVLVGRSIATELAAMRGFMLILVAAGLTVLALGLTGGWLIVSRAIRPVENISATARRIAEDNLSERINVPDTDSELGQLAGTLNSTFARLDAAFAQQKQFTADASHELRTPIAVIISEAQTTLARERTATEYRETIETCLDTAQQMRHLTESLLELAKLDASQQSTRREPLDLAELTRSRGEVIRSLAGRHGLRIAYEFAAASTSGNADHLGLVINNLVNNAIHYNKPGGTITVTTGTEAGEAFITVADTGHGIATEDLPLIFNRFYRADKSRSHAEGRCGLGLAICKAIVEAHGGRIEVASQVGVGTTFTVRLPA